MMNNRVNRILTKQIQLAEEVMKTADEATSFKQECGELKSKTENLAALLRQAANECSDSLERPTQRIMEETRQALNQALSLILKCGANTLKRIFTIIPVAAFPVVSSRLEKSIDNVSWLLHISAPVNYRGSEYLPPIAADEPVLFLIWEQIAILHTGSAEDHTNAATCLAAFARDSSRYGKLIIEEGGISPLLKLLEEGRMEEGRVNAARAIGLLGRDSESIQHLIEQDVCHAFSRIFTQRHLKLQAVVAWAMSVLAENSRKCQNLFAEHNIPRLLVNYLDYLTFDDKYADIDVAEWAVNPKEMAPRALWHLAKGPEVVQYNSAMAVMEISAVVEKDVYLRRSAFNPHSADFKAIVDQMLKIIENKNSKLLIPCIKTIGNLARDITETRIIGPLVRHLRVNMAYMEIKLGMEILMEVLIALTKYACTENDLHMDHSKAIISAGGVNHLINLVYFEKQMVQNSSLLLLSYIALHMPHIEELDHAHVLEVLEWATNQSSIMLDEVGRELLLESKSRVKLYLSKGLTP